MSALPWIVAGIGAGVIVGGAVYLRARKPEEPSGPPVDDCEKLRALGGDRAVQACKIAKAGAAVLGAIVPDTSDTKNVSLNGAAVERVHPSIVELITAKVLVSGTVGTYDTFRPMKAPYTTRYANGFVPIPGHPDFAKGAAGSQSMVGEEWFRRFGGGKSPSSLLSGDPLRDPYTFRWPAGRPWPSDAPTTPGERWAYKGRLIVCAAGTTVQGTDHRANAPACTSTSTMPTRPPPLAPTYPTTTSGTRDRRTDPPR